MSDFLILGDIMLGRRTPSLIKEQLLALDVKVILDKSEVVIANMEAPFFTNDSVKGFKVDQEMIKYCKDFTAFSLANNHIFDQELTGFEETKETLKNNEIEYFGTLKNPSYKKISDGITTLNIIGCMDFSIIKRKSEEEIKLYKQFILSFEDSEIIKKSIFNSDDTINILYVHGGDEFIPIISYKLKSLLMKYSEYGFDYIFVNHSHVTGSFYKIKNTKIFYGLGDFIFDGESYRRLKSYGVIIFSENNIYEKHFFKRRKEIIRIEKDNSKLSKLKFKYYSFLNKLSNRFTYPPLFWIFMISYQLNRTLFVFFNKGAKSGFKETFKRMKLIRRFL